MTDKVNLRLEQTFEELEEYERRGLFTGPEIKSIVSKRTHFEQLVARPDPKKTDYLRYIAYELNLHRLRRERVQKAKYYVPPPPTEEERAAKNAAKDKGAKQSASAYKFVKKQFRYLKNQRFMTKVGQARLASLFRRALRVFPEDIYLWQQYIASFQTWSPEVVQQVYVAAIRAHPTRPVFWLGAASWQYSVRTDVFSARSLFQRGLRLNPDSKHLWLEYFRMELHYVEKLRQRRVLAKSIADSTGLTADDDGDDKESDGEKDDTVADEQAFDLPRLPEEATVTDSAQPTLTTQIAFEEGAVPLIVYKNAVQAIPDDLDFRMGFVAIYKQFPYQIQGAKEVYRDLTTAFPTDPKALRCVAEEPLTFVYPDTVWYVRALAKTHRSLSQMLKQFPTTAMYLEAHTALAKALKHTLDNHALRSFIIQALHCWMQQVNDARDGSELLQTSDYSMAIAQWAMGYANIYRELKATALKSQISELEDAVPILKTALAIVEKTNRTVPQADEPWLIRVQLLKTLLVMESADPVADIDQAIHSQSRSAEFLAIYEQAVKRSDGSLTLWDEYIAFLTSQWELDVQALGLTIKGLQTQSTDAPTLPKLAAINTTVHDKFHALVKRAHLHPSSDSTNLKSLVEVEFVNWATKAGGLPYLRQVYQRLIKTSVPTASFYDRCIKLEKRYNRDEPAIISRLFERFVYVNPQSHQPWLGYLYFVYSQGDYERLAQVYWKAYRATQAKAILELGYKVLLDEKSSLVKSGGNA
ncbi:U3 snoRNP protein [Dimargaris verticillata]|uniref:U3 snoRNP protein n=1 Tax=Dimargaris verticillata TaxID=2761393 RepID=A0A9W8B2K4_9FUNG|nr:U3 snoRNP protein [Dimargaris verticillata]